MRTVLAIAVGAVSIFAQTPTVKSSHIVVYTLAGKKTKTIYTASRLLEAPNWSPDGKKLLVNTGGELYFLPVEGSSPELEKLNLAGLTKCNNDKGFSPDGKTIAFSSGGRAAGSQVFTVDTAGGTPKLIVPETPSYFHGFSPDGKWLAVVAQRDKNFDLYRVPAQGGEQERLTSNAGYDDGPDYSPDGKWIYFNSDRAGSWDIWRMPASGAGADDAKAERVTSDEGEDWFPHCSPDGKWLVFLTFAKGTAGHNGRSDVKLRMIPLPGAKLSSVKPMDVVSFFGGQGSINVNSWSPDSKSFSYVTYEQ